MLSMSMGRRNRHTTMKPIIIPMGLFNNPNKENGSRTCKNQEPVNHSVHSQKNVIQQNSNKTCLIISLLVTGLYHQRIRYTTRAFSVTCTDFPCQSRAHVHSHLHKTKQNNQTLINSPERNKAKQSDNKPKNQPLCLSIYSTTVCSIPEKRSSRGQRLPKGEYQQAHLRYNRIKLRHSR